LIVRLNLDSLTLINQCRPKAEGVETSAGISRSRATPPTQPNCCIERGRRPYHIGSAATMSKAYNSPTARLLQSSRLFSLPRPLPQAALETPSSTGAHRASDSATQFYPTHQAISTPSSSHYRGDWGLKRAIPGKTTKSSTPSIRVLSQDTSDHITEFESAADHERSRAKWDEMGVPITARGKRELGAPDKSTLSVYEDFLDNTDPDAAPIVLRSGADSHDGPKTSQAKRWKYAGPFIAGMQEGEFQRYVQRQLRARREEWTEYLMDHFAKQNYEVERREAQQSGKWYGPLDAAGPWVQADLVLVEAERQGELLIEKAMKSKSAQHEAMARQEGERLLAVARQRAQEYTAEGRRWEAPEEARKVLIQAQRTANAERANIERAGGDETGEGEERMQLIISDAITTVYRLLGIESSNTADIKEADRLIREAQTQISEIQVAKARMMNEWQAKRTPELRPSLEELSVLEKNLRDGHANLGSDLSKLITTFLDIPAVNTEIPGSSSNALTSGFGIELSNLGDNEIAPPTTHPAAGLSHIRTNAFMENHPVHGPQAYPSPILARVLMARSAARSNGNQAQLGVGGFVALDPITSGFGKTGRRNDVADPTHVLDPDLPGGNKIFVRPYGATVDEAGRVRLNVARADNEAIAVKEGNVEHIHQGRGSGAARSSSAVSLPPSFGRPRQSANYGFGLPDQRRLAMDERRPMRGAPQSRVSGYDAEAAKLGSGKVNEERTLEMIQELSRGVNQ
jgi:hypothetical protein